MILNSYTVHSALPIQGALATGERMRPTRYVPPSFHRTSFDTLVPSMSEVERRYMPETLFVAGDTGLLGPSVPRVAVIGTRTPSREGIARTRRLVRELVERGVVIVSGLAAGVDTIAHETAIHYGGRTIAVVGLPLDQVYPKENAELQMLIGAKHLLVSQFEPGVRTHRSFFVQRNRTMAILSWGTVVIEAGDSSGTLSQASETIRCGKPLFVLRSALERKDLEWPERFVSRGATVLDSSQQVVSGIHA